MAWSLLSYIVGVTNLSVFVLVSIVNLVLAVTVQLLALPFDRKRKACLRVNHLIWGQLHHLLPSIRYRRTIPAGLAPGPYVVVCNHTSVLDIPASMGLPLPLRVVGKQSLDRVFVLGWYMRFTRQILLGPGEESVQRFLAQSHEALRDGISVLVFPEGTRSRDARLAPFHRGAFRVAKDAGVPVLPVVVYGNHYVLPKGAVMPTAVYQTIQMRVLDPIDPEAFSTARALSNRVHRAMVEALGEIRVPPAALAPWGPRLEEAG